MIPHLRLQTVVVAWLCQVATVSPADRLRYNRDIRPILAENCFACHGADSASRKADLRLDQPEAAVKSRAIVPGDPAKSEILKRILSTDPEELMPPPRTQKRLKPQEKETLRRWIATGAEYEAHWSFLPPRRAELPNVRHAQWVKNPIDQFILAKLEEHGIEPAPEADRRTIARRLSLDLTGLPPSPELVESFLLDTEANAHERLVNRLLLSSAWGEHRARYWLDAARYADTHGIHFDNYRETYAYRDWVIRAFNLNLPFDRFTVEQLAGDLIETASLEQLVASGFNRCNMTTNEGGIIPEEYLVLYTRDRTETTSLIWMGLTSGCAVCHDHKFDPLTQREFYEMAAFFNNTSQDAMDGNIKNTPPKVPVPSAGDRERWDTVQREHAEVTGTFEERRNTARPDFDRWLLNASSAKFSSAVPAMGLRFHAPLNEGEGTSVKLLCDSRPLGITFPDLPSWDTGHVARKAWKSTRGAVIEAPDAGDFEKDQAFSCSAWVKLAKDGQHGAIAARMDEEHALRGWDLWSDGGKVGSHIVSSWDQDALRAISQKPLKAGEWTHVLLTYDGSSKASGIKIYLRGEQQETSRSVDRLKGSIRTTASFRVGERTKGGHLDELAVQDVRLYDRALSATEAELLASSTRAAWLVEKPASERSPAEGEELYLHWLQSADEQFRTLGNRKRALESEISSMQARGTYALVMQERAEKPTAFILHRGEYSQRLDQVTADTPDILPPFPQDFPRNRLGFAKWLFLPEQPLTARVTVNRFWQEVFGTGIVRTPGDFGISGELPTHPELLDWLAVEFRESGWDVKQLFRLIVTSATYRQAANWTREKLEKDPQNRLLSRGPRFRMDAEMLRDYALVVSDLLSPRIGGPSLKPYQPEGVWEAVAMKESNTRSYQQDSGESLYRRSLYTFWKRAAPPASMDILNAPNREVCTVRRERTNTPLQALVTLNDPQFFEAARRLAEKTLKDGGNSDESRIDFISRRALARPFRQEEQEVVKASLENLLTHYRSHPVDASAVLKVGESRPDASLDVPTLAAWTLVTNQLLNLDEALNK